MPLSRLTMDRFWLPMPGAEDGASAAERLSEHFRDDGNDATAAFTRPGPVARIDGLGAAGTTLVRGANYPLDGRRSTMQAPNGFAWRLSAPPGSLARLSFADSAAPTLVGVDLKGDYRISLSVSGAGPIDCDEALADGTAATTCETRTRRDSVPVVDTVRGQPLSMPVALDAGRITRLELAVRWDSAGDGSIALRTAAAAANVPGIEAAPCTDGLAVCVSVPPGAITMVPVRIDAVVADDDGDVDSHAASFDVFVPTELTVLTCVREVPIRPNNASVYPPATLDITDCVAGAGARGVRFFDDTGSELAAGQLTYVPPAGRMSVFVSAPPESLRRPIAPESELVAFSAECGCRTGRAGPERGRRDTLRGRGRRTGRTPRRPVMLSRSPGSTSRCGWRRPAAAATREPTARSAFSVPMPRMVTAECAAASTGAIRSRRRTC
jgi:hypothetical protein